MRRTAVFALLLAAGLLAAASAAVAVSSRSGARFLLRRGNGVEHASEQASATKLEQLPHAGKKLKTRRSTTGGTKGGGVTTSETSKHKSRNWEKETEGVEDPCIYRIKQTALDQAKMTTLYGEGTTKEDFASTSRCKTTAEWVITVYGLTVNEESQWVRGKGVFSKLRSELLASPTDPAYRYATHIRMSRFNMVGSDDQGYSGHHFVLVRSTERGGRAMGYMIMSWMNEIHLRDWLGSGDPIKVTGPQHKIEGDNALNWPAAKRAARDQWGGGKLIDLGNFLDVLEPFVKALIALSECEDCTHWDYAKFPDLERQKEIFGVAAPSNPEKISSKPIPKYGAHQAFMFRGINYKPDHCKTCTVEPGPVTLF